MNLPKEGGGLATVGLRAKGSSELHVTCCAAGEGVGTVMEEGLEGRPWNLQRV